jgi:hypothetical protein
MHDAPGSIGAQRGYSAMQVFANAGLYLMQVFVAQVLPPNRQAQQRAGI